MGVLKSACRDDSKTPLHDQIDEVLAEIFKVKDNLYFSKINFV